MHTLMESVLNKSVMDVVFICPISPAVEMLCLAKSQKNTHTHTNMPSLLGLCILSILHVHGLQYLGLLPYH